MKAQFNSLTKLATETGYEYVQRLEKIIWQAATPYKMALGKTDTFIGVNMLIFKRLPHSIKTWKDTQLGILSIDAKGQVIVSLRYRNGLLLCPDLETAFEKFETYYQTTISKYRNPV